MRLLIRDPSVMRLNPNAANAYEQEDDVLVLLPGMSSSISLPRQKSLVPHNRVVSKSRMTPGPKPHPNPHAAPHGHGHPPRIPATVMKAHQLLPRSSWANGSLLSRIPPIPIRLGFRCKISEAWICRYGINLRKQISSRCISPRTSLATSSIRLPI